MSACVSVWHVCARECVACECMYECVACECMCECVACECMCECVYVHLTFLVQG